MNSMTTLPENPNSEMRSKPVVLLAKPALVFQTGLQPVGIAYYNFGYEEWCCNYTGARIDTECLAGWVELPALAI